MGMRDPTDFLEEGFFNPQLTLFINPPGLDVRDCCPDNGGTCQAAKRSTVPYLRPITRIQLPEREVWKLVFG